MRSRICFSSTSQRWRSDFAAAVDISYKHLYGIETGTNTAAVETLYRIANHLGVDIEQVMTASKVGAA
ncbi:helix-turn-helix transcriptional regulator [Saccharopolyspora sp. NPDC050389]|uniref:helix-turn-helix domain-containing protein n=1 Tax=Saccharopolyspora sp. NPDC050389 TaxID=3155516 RepID=UPI0033E39A97